MKLQVSRIDLFADFQVELRVKIEGVRCRAELGTFEADGTLSGLQFGKRSSGTLTHVCTTRRSNFKFWRSVLARDVERHLRPSRDVLRIEFEVLRGALRESGSTTDEVLDSAGALWYERGSGLAYDGRPHPI